MGFVTPNRVVPFMDRELPCQSEPNKKALLIGINYGKEAVHPGDELRGPQRDASDMHNLLTETYGYKAENIVMLSDKLDVEDYLMPTKANIMRELQAFLSGQNAGDHYTFLFSGHASQSPSDDEGEQDGQDEQIVTSDNETIIDDILHDYLVKRLLPGSRLVTVFDTCHSGTLLDLPHHRCNRVASLTSSVRRPIRRMLEPVWSDFVQNNGNNVIRELRESLAARFLPNPFCSGYCPRIKPLGPNPNIFCISACKDSQRAYETDKGKSITRIIAKTLRKNPHPTLKQLMRATSKGSQALNRKIMREYALYVKAVKKYERLHGPQPAPPELMCQRDPQLSSLQPLVMESRFDL